MLAPNGKVSNLPEHLWKLTRTKNFKKWFGDWELMQKDVSVIPTSRHDFKNFADAEKWAKANIVGEYTNEDTGEEISISNATLAKYLSASAVSKSSSKDAHFEALTVLPDLIRKGVLVETVTDRDSNPDIKALQRFYAATINKDGEIERVKITVKQYPRNASKAYSYEVSEIETLDTKPKQDSDKPRSSSRMPRVSTATLLQGAKKNNGDLWDTSYSQVIDENGEPLVVYHGTNADFDAFIPNKALGGTIFVSPDPQEAGGFAFAKGANISPLFVNARNISPDEVLAYDEVAAAEEAKLGGYDAFRVADAFNGTLNYAVFDPNQIKSINNRGSFSGGTDSILRQAPHDTVESPLDSIYNEDGSINYEQVQNITADINEGKYRIQRLTPAGEQGRLVGDNRLLVGSSIVIGGSDSSVVGQDARKRRNYEEDLLEGFAKTQDAWVDDVDAFRASIRRGELKPGAEAQAYKVDDSVIKIAPIPYILGADSSILRFFDDKIALHNSLPHTAPYELIGFGRDWNTTSGSTFQAISATRRTCSVRHIQR